MKDNTSNCSAIPKLAIVMNSRVNTLCPVCGGDANSNIGVELVEIQLLQPVCRDCGIKIEPSLVYLLNLADSARLLLTSESDFGLSWE